MNKFLLCCSLLLSGMTFSFARPVKIWKPAELLKEADLVIIATPQATTDVKNQDLTGAKYHTRVSVETELEVQAVVKGAWKEKSLPVRHQRFYGIAGSDDERAGRTINGPRFLEFDRVQKHTFLIYLKLTSEGTYEPLTGLTDPGNSFFPLETFYHSRELNKIAEPSTTPATRE